MIPSTIHIDPAYVRILREEFGELADQLIDLLEITAVEALHEIDAALAAGDDDELSRVAHRLKGGCLNLGASTMASACLALETGAGDPADAIAELRAALAPTVQQLQAAGQAADTPWGATAATEPAAPGSGRGLTRR